MIKIERVEMNGWGAAIRGMRNPLNSWNESDSDDCIPYYEERNCDSCNAHKHDGGYCVGEKDLALMQKLADAGPDHGKFLRMIHVQMDVTAPLYWWKEAETYKVGTVSNSCSTMHTIHKKEFTLDDFSHEHLRVAAVNVLKQTIDALNAEREAFIGEGLPDLKGDRQCWYSMIQLLPSSYNQRRTLDLNYAVLRNMYHQRKNHKLDEWRDFCEWIETLPYSELITGKKNEVDG